ncbi:MAG: hypothetical protein ACJA1U_002242 [Bermanella sp.]
MTQIDLLFFNQKKADLKQGLKFRVGIKDVNGEVLPH